MTLERKIRGEVIYGKTYGTSTTCTDTAHVLPVSVGLAQARPNNYVVTIWPYLVLVTHLQSAAVFLRFTLSPRSHSSKAHIIMLVYPSSSQIWSGHLWLCISWLENNQQTVIASPHTHLLYDTTQVQRMSVIYMAVPIYGLWHSWPINIKNFY